MCDALDAGGDDAGSGAGFDPERVCCNRPAGSGLLRGVEPARRGFGVGAADGSAQH